MTLSAVPSLPRSSFRNQWLLLVLALLLLGAQTAYELVQSRRHLIEETSLRLANHSAVLAEELERRLRSGNAVLLAMREHARGLVDEKDGMRHLSREFDVLAYSLEGVRTLAIFDARGTVLASNRRQIIGTNFVDRAYFRTLRDQPQPDRLHLSTPFTTMLGVYSLVLARPVYGPDGAFAGIVTLTLDADSLRDLLVSLHPTPETRLSVVHGSGKLLKLVPERPEVPPSADMAINGGSFLARHIQGGQASSVMRGISGMVGTPSMVAMRTLQPADLGIDSPLYVAAATDDSDALADWHSQWRTRLILFLVIATLAVLALGIHQRRQRAMEHELASREQARQRSILVLQRFIDHLPGTAYVKDGASHTLMANRGFQTLLGMDPATMIGKTSQELFPGDFGAKIVADDRRVLDSGTTAVIEECFGDRDFESTKFVIDAGEGERWLGGMTLDISARKDAERKLAAQMSYLQELNSKLESAQNQLLQSEKMASIGQLAAGVAHELNNPIGYVHSNLAMLEQYLQDIFAIAFACEQALGKTANPDDFAEIEAMKREKDFDFIRKDVFQLMAETKEGLERVSKIVRDLKDFSRPGETSWQWADLHAGLDSTLNIVWNELKYKCTVSKAYGTLTPVWCVISQLNQVFMNLLVNAAQSIADKGEIVITTGQSEKDGLQWVFVAIRDTGRGIAPEHMNRLFDPFFTTKPVGQGTGLGLSVSYGIVQRHGGYIAVDSTPGVGSTFTIWLPVRPATA